MTTFYRCTHCNGPMIRHDGQYGSFFIHYWMTMCHGQHAYWAPHMIP